MNYTIYYLLILSLSFSYSLTPLHSLPVKQNHLQSIQQKSKTKSIPCKKKVKIWWIDCGTYKANCTSYVSVCMFYYFLLYYSGRNNSYFQRTKRQDSCGNEYYWNNVWWIELYCIKMEIYSKKHLFNCSYIKWILFNQMEKYLYHTFK